MDTIDDENAIKDKCTCDVKEYEEHSCPFQCEINDNCDNNFCNCCPYCTQNCADDI